MVSSSIPTHNSNKAFLIIKMDLMEFAVPITQVDGIVEFDNEFHENTESEFCLGKYYNQNKVIPILNLKSYLHCPSKTFNQTTQSRILFLRCTEKIKHSLDTINIGFGVDALVGMYHTATSERGKKTQLEVSEELKCFEINSYVKINATLYPILDLIELLDLTSLKGTLEQLLPEKI
ncbi:MAG: chemotaxis protein CheW [Candidatus Heimdallarchaeota archaeon]|nr:MAG: chemotaxis protein CheW [Candidatus Heimdallarchaeota archaeon]